MFDGYAATAGEVIFPEMILEQTRQSPIFLVLLLFGFLQHIRLIMFRLGDKTRKE